MKVLMSAYACEPNAGSEPGAGWHMAMAAAQRHEVWVLTRANNREVIERELALHPAPNAHFVYFDLPSVWLRIKRLPYGTQLYYLRWQKAIAPIVQRLHDDVGFDVVHHVTFAIDWMPAGAIEACPAPSVWGPVGGMTGMPWELWRALGLVGLVQESARAAITHLCRRMLTSSTRAKAALIVGQNPDEARLPGCASRLVIEPNCSAEPRIGDGERSPDWLPEERPVALAVGRLVPLKGVACAIEAVALAADPWQLVVVGDGADKRRLRRRAESRGVSTRVHFVGHRPNSELLAALDNASVLIAASLHEGAGFAVAEALSRGCPVVCTDRGGHRVVVGPADGHRVKVDRHLPASLAHALSDVRERRTPTDRWSHSRWVELLSGWYEVARCGDFSGL